MKKNDVLTDMIDALNELKLPNMAATLDALYHSPEFHNLDRITLIRQLIDAEYQVKIDQRYQNRLKRAHLSGSPQKLDTCVDSQERIYLPSKITIALSSLAFVQDGLNVCILGPSDSGKSYLAKAIGIH